MWIVTVKGQGGCGVTLLMAFTLLVMSKELHNWHGGVMWSQQSMKLSEMLSKKRANNMNLENHLACE